MKRTVSLALALAMVLSLFCVPAFAATTVASGTFGADGDNLTWVLDNEGTLTISGEGEMGNTVPWQSDRNEIKSVVIEDGVTNIGFSAFEVCSSLTSITIPDSVTSIGEGAFEECSVLESLRAGEQNTWIYVAAGAAAVVLAAAVTVTVVLIRRKKKN